MISPPPSAHMLSPARLGAVHLRNRVLKAATFENRTQAGRVTPELIEFHRLLAEGGVGMTVVASGAVSIEGRTRQEQLLLVPGVEGGLAALTAAVHAERGKVGLQLDHAGPVADPRSTGRTAITPMGEFNPQGLCKNRAATLEDLQRLVMDYRRAARMARECGFDGLEVQAGHSHLLAAFLSPFLNQRRDAYGGALENRARLLLEVVAAVRQEAGPDVAVWVKLGMSEGHRDGLGVQEACQVARLLEAQGGVDALELTAGSSLLNPMYIVHGGVPARTYVETFRGRGLLYPVMKLAAPVFLKKYAYRPLYLLDLAREVRKAVRLPLILLGGVTSLQDLQAAEREGFEFVALGRSLLAEPHLVRRWQRAPEAQSICTHCNLCLASLDDPRGTGFVLPGAEPLPQRTFTIPERTSRGRELFGPAKQSW